MDSLHEKRLAAALEGVRISQSGYGGILSSGMIVDRRDHPKAIPMQKNSMFGIPKPLPVLRKRWPPDPCRSRRI